MVRIDHLQALIEREGLPPGYAEVVGQWWQPLAQQIAGQARLRHRPLLVGINGSQGSGKSTMSTFVAELLRQGFGLKTAVISLDDLYLTRAERQRLAAAVHPLLATRGVPGTHDVALGLRAIRTALTGEGMVRLPRFDKSTDERAAEELWPEVRAPLDILLFEGWCIAAEPSPAADLLQPLNQLEAEEDANGRWRSYVNAQLEGPYRALFDSLDLGIMLRAPDFEQVASWRLKQEHKLIARTGRGMDDAAVRRFVMHYERITRRMLAQPPARMDVIFDLDGDQIPVRATGLG